ncbi:DUF2834 domain-containing protein [Nocardia seriolae]|uniref:Holotricin-3 n=1 Tax=Nocardia seriolae TaxID=37332 RepID=A0A0B8NIM5_9NOCA|nr:DUF2834 domain-containing protein [Nocardia seriolae]APA99970.1 hypothetical protein NS506_05934 [Nocardia seriolae]MTJ64652.1 DUF2834 domain-containing protein [Nocardia seriolae]MTJ73037.1 DUF2834 domain-containing protein [Nocardia seriolae]MTJ89495.1 DUF2834 domain-containing protein [Nocardia seriolae]MTK33470.1 DUF2834 domain-containing protein [Nocardia seriolae]
MSGKLVDQSWRRPTLIATLIAAFVTQNSIALPYVRRKGPKSALDFFVGDIYKTVPGRFAMVDLIFVVLGFHLWAFAESRRLGIMRWWAASFALTFTVGIATAIPFFLLARDFTVDKAAA